MKTIRVDQNYLEIIVEENKEFRKQIDDLRKENDKLVVQCMSVQKKKEDTDNPKLYTKNDMVLGITAGILLSLALSFIFKKIIDTL